ncbi:MAG: LysE family translocator [Pseudomonadota bacterium]
MLIESFAVAAFGTVLAQASPGPNLVAVASAGLSAGRRAALAVVAGVATGVLVWAAAAAFGLGALLAVFPGLLVAMKIVGGGYLLWLGIKGLRAAWRGNAPTLRGGGRGNARLGAHWRRGLAVVLTNPKAALMWAAVSAFLFGQGLDPAAVLAFGPVGAVSAMLVYGGYAFLFSTGTAMRFYAQAARRVDAAFGAVFGAMGGALLIDGLRSGAR